MKNEGREPLVGQTNLRFSDLHRLLEAGATHLEANKEIVNSLNVFPVPDGDTGTNMLLTLKSTLDELSRIQPGSMKQFTEAVTRGSLLGARGNSGVILSQLFRGMCRSLDSKEEVSLNDLAQASAEAVRTAYQAVMKPVEGTILTVAREASIAALRVENHQDLNAFLDNILQAARRSLANTPNLLPILKEAGVVDAGGQGLVFLFDGMLRHLRGETKDEISAPTEANLEAEEIFADEMAYRYDVQFLIRGTQLSRNSAEKSLQEMGDSLLVIGEETLLRVHIHSNIPYKVLEVAAEIGSLDQVMIEDMHQQHEEFVRRGKPADAECVGLVAVSTGQGFEEIFNGLGVDQVVMGGQSMNPSTREILDAIDRLSCTSVIVLPNNPNVIGTALQAKSIANKKISVLATHNLPQGVSAALAFDRTQPIENNLATMERAMQKVHAGEITYSVRDGSINGFDFHQGTILGMIDDRIAEVGEDPNKVCLAMVHKMLDAAPSEAIVCIYRGEEMAEDDAEEILQELLGKYPLASFEQHYGGQPFYYYIVSLEE